MRAAVTGMVVLGLVGLAACQRLSGVHSNAAVKHAIEEHLKRQPNVVFQNMKLEVENVSFHGDAAEALVKFDSKQAPGLAVGVLYKLRRIGNAWQVESTSMASMPGTTPHGNSTPPMPSQPEFQPSH